MPGKWDFVHSISYQEAHVGFVPILVTSSITLLRWYLLGFSSIKLTDFGFVIGKYLVERYLETT